MGREAEGEEEGQSMQHGVRDGPQDSDKERKYMLLKSSYAEH